MIAIDGIEIDWSKVSETDQTVVCRTLISGAERLFDLMQTNPDLIAEFEAWQKARNH